jgi:hypothetical protein
MSAARIDLLFQPFDRVGHQASGSPDALAAGVASARSHAVPAFLVQGGGFNGKPVRLSTWSMPNPVLPPQR